MDESDGYERDELDDIIDSSGTDTTLSTTASSIASSMFDRNHFVLELHELHNDAPGLDRHTDTKVRKQKKKLKGPPIIKRTESSDSSDIEDASLSQSFNDDSTKDQYFDAHESYYGLTESEVTGMDDNDLESREDLELPQEQKTVVEHSVEQISNPPPSNEIRKLVKRPDLVMDKASKYKSKNKKSTVKPKTAKKRKNEGPTCSMFLAEISKRLASKKKRQEESSTNIVQTIIESITNSLPIKFLKKRFEVVEQPVTLENLKKYAPELTPNDKIDIPYVEIKTPGDNVADVKRLTDLEETTRKPFYKVPKMPVVNSEVLKVAADRSKRIVKEDAGVNTGQSNDLAVELAKHVNTLKKISLIAEEFNKKTAKNLKEIVDSVQEELLKKLEAIQAEEALNDNKNIESSQKP
ncbi:unnamed protein product, partial [Iphiclides podalirius]